MSKYYEKILHYAKKGWYTEEQIERLYLCGAIDEEEKETILAARNA